MGRTPLIELYGPQDPSKARQVGTYTFAPTNRDTAPDEPPPPPKAKSAMTPPVQPVTGPANGGANLPSGASASPPSPSTDRDR